MLFNNNASSKDAIDSLKVHTDFIFINRENKLAQDVFYQIDSNAILSLVISCYKYNSNDSNLVYSKRFEKILLKEGLNKSTIVFDNKKGNSYILNKFYNIYKNTDIIPPGSYKIYVDIKERSHERRYSFLRNIDSTLIVNSKVRKDLNKILESTSSQHTVASTALDRAKNKMKKTFKLKSITYRIKKNNEKNIIDFYYQSWFIGRYEVIQSEVVSNKIMSDKMFLNGSADFQGTNDLENYQSVFHQMRTFKKNSKENDIINGEVELSANASGAQEVNSQQDNNYVELRGRIDLPIKDIPFVIEGGYTSQDAHRTVKASYIRFHYDAEKAKSNLQKQINNYNSQYTQTMSKMKGMDQVYRTQIIRFTEQKKQIENELRNESKISENDRKLSTNDLKVVDVNTQRSNQDENDSTQNNNVNISSNFGKSKMQDSLKMRKELLLEKKNQIQTLNNKIEKLSHLLAQNNNTKYFDSAIAYERLNDLNKSENQSYKRMIKKADDILPEGKSKSFISGLTNLDAGIFPKYTSKYTMAGQTLKGLDFGYDFNFCQVGVTLGGTEYVGRDGTLDKYTCYSTSMKFKPINGEKIELVYYGYTPSSKMLSEDNFYKNISIALPSFMDPVHIISANYEGDISKFIKVTSEVATAIKRTTNGKEGYNSISSNKMAYDVNVLATIPKTSLCFEADYQNAGKDFQNSSLPINPAGTEKYLLYGQGDFIQSFLTLGVEYNYMQQNSFASKGSNTRWGFDMKTHSKRYPSFSLSYKPYSTFRSYNDTLNIPQRPMFGEVWISKANYQFKRYNHSFRFMLLYNKSNSVIDTLTYGSDMLQFTVMHTYGSISSSLSIGTSRVMGNNLIKTDSIHNNSKFISASVSYLYNKRLTLSLGNDVGFSRQKLSKYGLLVGCAYRFKNTPCTIRFNCRYMTYKLTDNSLWKPLPSGSVDILWQFKRRLKV